MSNAMLAVIADNLEDQAGQTTPANPGLPGYWYRIALAAEALSNTSSVANPEPSGYMLRTALALESLSGGSGEEENPTVAGYERRIAEAMETITGQSGTGTWLNRIYELSDLPLAPSTVPVVLVDPPNAGTLIMRLQANDDTTLFQDVAGTLTPAVGQPIGRWAGADGTTFTLTAAADNTTRPTLTEVNGARRISFDGSNDVLFNTTGLNLINTGGHVIAAMKGFPAVSTYPFAEGRVSGTTPLAGYMRTHATVLGQTTSTVTNDAGTVVLAQNSQTVGKMFNSMDRVCTVRISNTSIQQQVDGGRTSAAGFTLGAATINRFGMGALVRSSISNWSQIEVGAMLVYPTAQTGNDLLDAEAFVGSVVGLLTNAAQSWWTTVMAKHPTLPLYAVGFTKLNGIMGVAEIHTETGQIINIRRLQDTATYTQDDHNAVCMFYTGDGFLNVVYTGHANPVGGGDDSTYRHWRSSTGRIADLTAQSNITNSGVRSNYIQAFVMGANVILVTNYDNDNAWTVLWSGDSGATFAQGGRIVNNAVGGGADQVYLLAKSDGTTLRMICNKHPQTAQNAIRYIEANVASGVMSSGATNLYGSYATAPADIDTLPIIYTPASGKSCRLLDMNADASVIYIAEFNNNALNTPPVTGVVHHALVWDGVGNRNNSASWAVKTIGAAGEGFYSSYVGACVFGHEPHSGLRAYRTYNDTSNGTYNLARMDSANNGDTWSSTVLLTQPQGKLPRVFSCPGATAEVPVVLLHGDYVDYTSWVLSMQPIVT